MEKSPAVSPAIKTFDLPPVDDNEGSKFATFCMTWDLDVAKAHVFHVKYTDSLTGKLLRRYAAKELCMVPAEVILEQKRGYRILGGPPVVFTADGGFASSSGKIVPNCEIREKIWCTIKDEEEVPLGGGLSLHLMVRVEPMYSHSSSSSDEEKTEKGAAKKR